MSFAGDLKSTTSETRVDGLALEGEDAKGALVDASKGLMADEAFEALDSKCELAMGESALAGEAALPEAPEWPKATSPRSVSRQPTRS